jgi:hypothetical protein
MIRPIINGSQSQPASCLLFVCLRPIYATLACTGLTPGQRS